MNAMETIQAVRRADQEVTGWPVNLYHQVTSLCPAHVLENGQTARDWAITVCLLRRDWEAMTEAAHRLATYLVLHQERYSATPTLATIRRTQTPERNRA